MTELQDSEKKESQIQDETSSTRSVKEGDFLSSKGRKPSTSHSTSSSQGHSRGGSDVSDRLDDLEYVPDILAPICPGDDDDVRGPLSPARTRTSIGSSASRPPDFEVAFEHDDPENPKNWPLWYRAWIIFAVSFSTWAVVVYSTNYTSTIPGLMNEFNFTSQPLGTLGVTTYLLGMATGSVIVAPLSEVYGRRPVYIVCLALYSLLVIPCALATSLVQILVIRFFGAAFGAAMVSNSPGTVVDISDHQYISVGMSLWSVAPLNGPVTGPIIGGFVYQYLGWRWANWFVLIVGGASLLIMTLTVKETYAPTILQKKAARKRKELDDDRYWSRYDHRTSTWEVLKLNMSRPFVLAVTEPILIFFNIWISIVYAILYLCFVAYPIVFVQYRHWSSGLSGLGFVGIGIGTMLAICLEPVWRHIVNSHPKDPETGHPFPEATGAIMSIGAVLTPVGQLVFSWTCLPVTIHWAIPIAFGIPFGMGNTLAFIYSSNYLAGSYGIYAASAFVGNAVIRSIVGGTLPLAGPAMYKALTPQWAGTLLGLLEVCLIPIPLIFYRYGAKIRAKSKVIRHMKEDQDKNDSRRAKQLGREARRREREMAAVEVAAKVTVAEMTMKRNL